MKIKFTINLDTASREEEVELPDDCTDAKIEQEWQDWCWNYLDGSWSKEEKSVQP